jgi:hypothetical protein
VFPPADFIRLCNLSGGPLANGYFPSHPTATVYCLLHTACYVAASGQQSMGGWRFMVLPFSFLHGYCDKANKKNQKSLAIYFFFSIFTLLKR